MDDFVQIGGGGGGGGVSPDLPNGYNPTWLTPPAITDTTVNGKTDVIALMCNVLDIGNRNYFSCIAAGDYTVNVYTAVNGTLISTVNTASGVQTNWQIDYAACTKQIDAETRQAYVEIVPQSGQSLTIVRFNTHHPAETNVNSAQNIVAVFGALPALTTATSMFQNCYALQSVTLPALPAVINATSMFYSCYALQYVTLPALPALTAATGMFGTTAESVALRSVRKLITTELGSAFTAAGNLVLRYTAIQEIEALAWIASLGSSTNAFTFDLRNNPFSTSALVAPAILSKFPNATVILV